VYTTTDCGIKYLYHDSRARANNGLRLARRTGHASVAVDYGRLFQTTTFLISFRTSRVKNSTNSFYLWFNWIFLESVSQIIHFVKSDFTFIGFQGQIFPLLTLSKKFLDICLCPCQSPVWPRTSST